MNDNKLICEFMGGNIIGLDDVRQNNRPLISSADGYTLDELKYHTSWDWLMPVIDSIYIMGIDAQESKEIQDIMDGLVGANFPHTYKAVVEFIKTNNNGRV